jgi:hypothetical protein
VTDVGAYAPRDYTAARRTQPGPVALHNHQAPAEARRQAGLTAHSGWYTRVENNGWRPMSERSVHEMGGANPGPNPNPNPNPNPDPNSNPNPNPDQATRRTARRWHGPTPVAWTGITRSCCVVRSRRDARSSASGSG